MVVSSRTPEGTPQHCPVCGADVQVEPSRPPGDAPCPSCGHLLWFTWDDLGAEQVIRPSSRAVDADLMARLCDALNPREGAEVVLDLEDVRYLSSQALTKLIDMKRKIRAAGQQFRLRNLHPDLHDVFRICRLDQVFEIEA